MKNLLFPQFTLDDLVFEHRNHAYGAFAIRKNYEKNMAKAFFLAIMFFVSAFLAPGIIKSLNQRSNLDCLPEEFRVNEVFVSPNIQKVYVQPKDDGHLASKKELIDSKSEIPTKVVDDAINQIIDHHPLNLDNLYTESDGLLNSTNEMNEFSQNAGGSGVGIANENAGSNSSSEEVMLVPDELPVFGNNQSALSEYLAKSIMYPSMARENHIEGKVVIEFIIDKNGNVISLNLLRGIGGGCDEEVFRVINNMPKWKAGFHHGKPVNVKMVLPVAFKLR